MKDNAKDAVVRGQTTVPRMKGSAVGTARLTETDVLRIRAMAGHMIYKDIAAVFNVDTTTIGMIVRRKTWSHI